LHAIGLKDNLHINQPLFNLFGKKEADFTMSISLPVQPLCHFARIILSGAFRSPKFSIF
jgi:hypothetical protein